MAVYRFKVSFEDDEEIFREIEIKSSQSFEDFHKSILSSLNFDDNHDASFYISDDLWRKGEEVALREKSNPQKNNNQAEVAIRLMNKCKMAALIDDPHQKFVYEYGSKNPWTFMIELMKIVADDAKAAYPKCVKTVGVAPKNLNSPILPPIVLDEDEFDDDIPVDEEAYVNAHCEDGIAELEGVEGEEEDSEESIEIGEDDESEFEDLADQEFEED